jgi:hypothetical protein
MICCEECPASLHFSCCVVPLDPSALPEGDWYCAVCECERARNQVKAEGADVQEVAKHGLTLARALAEDVGLAPEAEFWLPPTWILEVGEAIGGPPVNPLAAFGYDVVPNTTGTGLQFAPYRNPANAVLVGPSGTLALRTCSVCDGSILSDLNPRVNALADIFGADRDFLDAQSYPRGAPDRLHCVRCGVVQHPWCTPNPHAAFAVAASPGARDKWQCADCAPCDDVDAVTLLTTVRVEERRRDSTDDLSLSPSPSHSSASSSSAAAPTAVFAETAVVRQELATIDEARERSAAEAAPAARDARAQDEAMLVLLADLRRKHPELGTPSKATLASLAALSPAFVQFLAWQRLMQLNAKAAELETALGILEEGERELNANALVKASVAASATRQLQGDQLLPLLDTAVVAKYESYNEREGERRKASDKVRTLLGLPPLHEVASCADTGGLTALTTASVATTNQTADSRRGGGDEEDGNGGDSAASSRKRSRSTKAPKGETDEEALSRKRAAEVRRTTVPALGRMLRQPTELIAMPQAVVDQIMAAHNRLRRFSTVCVVASAQFCYVVTGSEFSIGRTRMGEEYTEVSIGLGDYFGADVVNTVSRQHMVCHIRGSIRKKRLEIHQMGRNSTIVHMSSDSKDHELVRKGEIANVAFVQGTVQLSPSFASGIDIWVLLRARAMNVAIGAGAEA